MYIHLMGLEVMDLNDKGSENYDKIRYKDSLV